MEKEIEIATLEEALEHILEADSLDEAKGIAVAALIELNHDDADYVVL